MATKKQKAAVDAPYAVLQAASAKSVEAVTKALEGYDELVVIGKDNLDAVVQANTAALAGAQRLNAEFAAYVKGAYEANLAATKALSGAKSVQQAVDLQTGYMQAALDKAMAESAKVSELALAAANEVAAPLQARTKVAVDKLFTPHAA